ncbi:YaiI/YqxD family protein [Paraneptunicella aestuarii]|uniref:YaiI/YqxD family protein n=1 Tax=Paraneptunicella aestuarii TaxID=2831148 RepID=UPI001E3ADD7C|nr:YaiI/YqxD family protein [Paraneptunicella aestuarii]UAA38411.1 YaiI/YqxD family protein [Paraneptunicella aestuarii]
MSERAPQIWVDADACPKYARETLCRAADRTHIHITFVANTYLRLPPSAYTQFVQVEKGFDIADNEIVKRAQDGDLVITSDIPLASEVIDKGALALAPRGEMFTKTNIKSRLNMRDFMDTMRASGVDTGGSPPISQTEQREFANELDRWLAKNKPKN